MADKELAFLINEERYPVPGLDTFNMAELAVLYDYCGLTLEDFFDVQEGETDEEAEARQERYVRHPGFKRTLLYVAYQRGNPDEKPATVRKLVDAVNGIDFLKAAIGADSDEPLVDPTQTSPSTPDDPSGNETVSSNGNGGDASTPTTTEPVTSQEATGTGGSDTSAGSVPLRSVS